MTTTATPEPGKKINRIGLEMAAVPRRQDDAVRRLRAQRDFRADHRRVLRDGHRPARRHQAVGHRLLEQEPGVFPRRRARLQHRARPHAVGRHRRGARQPHADRHRRQRRRRHGRDRHRPVRAPDAPQRADRSTSSRTTAATASRRGSSRRPPTSVRRPRAARRTSCRRSTPARWRSISAPRSWRGRSRATRSSCCRSSRRRSAIAAPA